MDRTIFTPLLATDGQSNACRAFPCWKNRKSKLRHVYNVNQVNTIGKKDQGEKTYTYVFNCNILTGRLAHLNCNILWEKKNNDTAKKLDKPTTTRKKRDIYVIFWSGLNCIKRTKYIVGMKKEDQDQVHIHTHTITHSHMWLMWHMICLLDAGKLTLSVMWFFLSSRKKSEKKRLTVSHTYHFFICVYRLRHTLHP